MNVFTVEREQDIVIVSMDDKSQAQNVLNLSIQQEFDALLSELEEDKKIKGLIFTSTKPDVFIAGADINMLQDFAESRQAMDASKKMHALTQQLSSLPFVTVAAIHGSCLGGGLELVLALDYRIVSTHSSSRLGLPEVQLGLLPGGGGTQRLPRLIDLPSALDMMLTGRQLNAKRAKKLGVIDELVKKEVLIDVAKKYIAKGKPKRKKSLQQKVMQNAMLRKLVISQARKKVLKKTKGHYPAPLKILETVEQGLSGELAQGLTLESKHFGELLMSAQSKQLVTLFFATTELKKNTGVSSNATARAIKKIGVLGAGLMGAGISAVTIDKAKLPVRLKDIHVDGLAKGVAYVGKIFDKKVARKRLQRNHRDQIMARLTATTDYSGFANTDVVIEAVFEKLELKQNMIKDIESVSGDKEVVFATNTSALPIDDIASKANHPERVVGMHYFSPVEKMPLLEVVKGSKTADWATATAVELGKQQGKTVIVVNDGPGFYTTRILVPYIMEAVRLVLEGVSIERIDNALEEFGFPVGPIKLMDEVGIDVGSHIVATLNHAFGERIPLIEGMDKLEKDNRKGRKNKRGFYDYSKQSKRNIVDESIYTLLGVKIPGGNHLSDEMIAERVVITMVNEAAYCLQESILHTARDGDIGAIFGLGFPPFLGGPFRYMDSIGIAEVVVKLGRLTKQYGERFTPSPNLVDMAKKQKRFY